MAYQNYINYITSITDLSNSDFKKNPNYIKYKDDDINIENIT